MINFSKKLFFILVALGVIHGNIHGMAGVKRMFNSSLARWVAMGTIASGYPIYKKLNNSELPLQLFPSRLHKKNIAQFAQNLEDFFKKEYDSRKISEETYQKLMLEPGARIPEECLELLLKSLGFDENQVKALSVKDYDFYWGTLETTYEFSPIISKKTLIIPLDAEKSMARISVIHQIVHAEPLNKKSGKINNLQKFKEHTSALRANPYITGITGLVASSKALIASLRFISPFIGLVCSVCSYQYSHYLNKLSTTKKLSKRFNAEDLKTYKSYLMQENCGILNDATTYKGLNIIDKELNKKEAEKASKADETSYWPKWLTKGYWSQNPTNT